MFIIYFTDTLWVNIWVVSNLLLLRYLNNLYKYHFESVQLYPENKFMEELLSEKKYESVIFKEFHFAHFSFLLRFKVH